MSEKQKKLRKAVSEGKHKLESLDQLGNYIADKNENLDSDIKEILKDAPVSTALPHERKKFLNYAISLLQTVTYGVIVEFSKITGKPSAGLSAKEVARALRNLMTLRIMGYTYEAISTMLFRQGSKVSPEQLQKADMLALKVVKAAIEERKNYGTPIING